MEVIFFNSKVHKDIYELGISLSTKAASIIGLLEHHGSTLGMPYSKNLSRNLYELRVRGKRELRMLYCFHQNHAVILHSFIKKTQRTPKREIELALKRIAQLTRT